MNYSFDATIASKIGVEEAIVIHNFQFWITKNKANERHFHEDRYWTYNSAKALKRLFPFWSEKQIRRILDSLIKQDVLVVANFNQLPFDQTRWYAFTDDWKSFEDVQKGQNDVPKRETPILPNGKMELPKREDQYQMVNTDGKPIEERGHKQAGHFVPPTILEIKERCKEIGLSEREGEKFFNHYETVGWRVGKRKMEKWKSALAGWKLRNEDSAPVNGNGVAKPRPNGNVNPLFFAKPGETGKEGAQRVAKLFGT